MDEDELIDETIGSLLLNVGDIIDGKCNGFSWKNVYGSPMGQSDSREKRAMNENPEIASNWKGRVLIQITCEKTEKPVAKVETVDDEILAEAQNFLNKRKFRVLAEIG